MHPPSVRRHLVLEPRSTGHLHLGEETHGAVWLDGLYPPPVDGVADPELIGIGTPAPHPHATHQKVEKSPDAPQRLVGVPARRSPDPADRRETRLWRHRDTTGSRIDQAAFDSDTAIGGRHGARRGEGVGPSRLGELVLLVAKRGLDGFGDALRLDSEDAARPIVVGDRCVGDALDQLAADARVERCHESEPEAAQVRCEDRNRNHVAPQTSLVRVLLHQLGIGHAIGAGNLVDGALGRICLEGALQVGEKIPNRDRLRLKAHPARGHHHRQSFDQRADHFEGETPRSDHDGGAKLDHRTARVSENAPDLVAASEVRREAGLLLGEATQIDDAADSRPPGSLTEVPSGLPVSCLEVTLGTHGVDQVVGGLDFVESRGKTLRIEEICTDDLGGTVDPGSQVFGAPGKTADGTTRRLEPREEPPTDVAAGTRQQDGTAPAHCSSPSEASSSSRRSRASRWTARSSTSLAGRGCSAETRSSSARASSRRSGWRSSSVSARRS